MARKGRPMKGQMMNKGVTRKKTVKALRAKHNKGSMYCGGKPGKGKKRMY
jgi:hypothetical protein